MGFRKMLFGKEEKEIKIIGGLVLLIGIIANLSTMFEAPFTPPEFDTPQQFYGMPRPDPNRTVHFFNHRENRWVYTDERVIEERPPSQPRPLLRQKRRHRLFDELIREISDDIRDDIEMSLD